MATQVIYYLDPNVSGSGDRWPTLEDLISAYAGANGGSLDLVANDHELHIRLVDNTSRASAYDLGTITTDIDHPIHIYGWDESANGGLGGTALRTIDLTGSFTSILDLDENYTEIHHLHFREPSNNLGSRALEAVGQCVIRYCKFEKFAVGLELQTGIVEFCWYDQCRGAVAFGLNQFRNGSYRNCIATNALGRGFDVTGSGGLNLRTILNCVAYGCDTNWGTTNTVQTSRNNAGESGDTIRDSVGGTSIIITSSDFVDALGGDYHLSTNSKLRHNHVDYPSGDNTYAGPSVDWDGDALPTYSTDDDRWDTGFDYLVSSETSVTVSADTNAFTFNVIELITTGLVEGAAMYNHMRSMGA